MSLVWQDFSASRAVREPATCNYTQRKVVTPARAAACSRVVEARTQAKASCMIVSEGSDESQMIYLDPDVNAILNLLRCYDDDTVEACHVAWRWRHATRQTARQLLCSEPVPRSAGWRGAKIIATTTKAGSSLHNYTYIQCGAMHTHLPRVIKHPDRP
jgi:hypothetical protein